MRWIADDPDPDTRGGAAAGAGRGAWSAPPARPTSWPTGCPRRSGSAPPGCAGRCAPGPAGMNVAVVRRATAGLAAWLARHGRARHGRGRPRRPARLGGVRRGRGARCWPGPGSPCARCPDRCRRRCWPSRCARSARWPGCRSPPRTTRRRTTATRCTWPTVPSWSRRSDAEIEAAIARRAGRRVAVPTGDRRRRRWTSSSPTWTGSARLPRGTARELRVALTPMHGVGRRDRGARAAPGRVHRRARGARRRPSRTRTSRPSPSRTRRSRAPPTRCWRWPPRSAPTSRSPSTRTPTGARWPCRDAAGGWRMLTGDETGVLLGDHLLRGDGGTSPTRWWPPRSCPRRCCAPIAAAHGARYAETLTGFKWIVRGGPGPGLRLRGGARLLRRPGRGARQGRHRGRGAGLRPGGQRSKAAGRTLADRLDELAVAHGVHRTEGMSVRLEPAARDAAVERLRTAPPRRLGGRAARRRTCWCCAGRGERLVVRPSGTEPKLKAYLEVVEPVPDDGLASAQAARARPARRAAGRGTRAAGRTVTCRSRAASTGCRPVGSPPMARPKVHDEALRRRLLRARAPERCPRDGAARAEPAHAGPRVRHLDHRGLLAVRRQARAAHRPVRRRLRPARPPAGRVPPGADAGRGPGPAGAGVPARRAGQPAPVRGDVRRADRAAAAAEARTAAGTALGPLREFVAAGRASTSALRPDTDPAAASLTLWATVHGWVSLQLRGFLPPGAEARFENALRAVLDGWRPVPATVRRRPTLWGQKAFRPATVDLDGCWVRPRRTGGRPRRRGRGRCRRSR